MSASSAYLDPTYRAVRDKIPGAYTLAKIEDQCELIKRLIADSAHSPDVKILARPVLAPDTITLLECLRKAGQGTSQKVTLYLLGDGICDNSSKAIKSTYEILAVECKEQSLPVNSDHLIVIGSSYVLNDFSEAGIEFLENKLKGIFKKSNQQSGSVKTHTEAAGAVYVENDEILAKVMELVY